MLELLQSHLVALRSLHSQTLLIDDIDLSIGVRKTLAIYREILADAVIVLNSLIAYLESKPTS